MDLVLLFVYLAIAIGFSFLCSIAEAVLLSITPSFIAEQQSNSSASAQRIIKLKANIDRPLSAILSLNTIAHTVGAAGVGAQSAKAFGDTYVGVTSAVLTLLILIFSEIIPKSIGAMHWRTLAGPVCWMIGGLIFFMLPLVWFSEALTRLISRGKKQQVVTRAEILAMTDLGAQEGLLANHESRILQAIMKLDSVRVEDIMTPRPVVISLEKSVLVSSVAEQIKSMPVSRIPIYQDRRDAVSGFVLKSELMASLLSDETDRPVSEFQRSMITVHEDEPIAVLFEKMLDQRAQIALVTDNFGGMEGIVTMEDVVETLLEIEIVDELDATVDMRDLAKTQWQRRLQRQGIEAEIKQRTDGDSENAKQEESQ